MADGKVIDPEMEQKLTSLDMIVGGIAVSAIAISFAYGYSRGMGVFVGNFEFTVKDTTDVLAIATTAVSTIPGFRAGASIATRIDQKTYTIMNHDYDVKKEGCYVMTRGEQDFVSFGVMGVGSIIGPLLCYGAAMLGDYLGRL